MAARVLALIYGVASYATCLGVFLYAVGFVGNIGVPRGIDGAAATPFATALGIDLVLLAIFAVQHSVMARPAFKRAWTRVVPRVVERSTFVFAANASLALLFWQWRPLGGLVWQVDTPWLRALLVAASAYGWLQVLVTTFLIDHFEQFGLKQVWQHFRGVAPSAPHFVVPGPYRMVRHPLYLGFLIAFWAAPTMTVAHLVFAVMTTAYILVAIQFEERDLIVAHPEYAAYRRDVPMILPVPGRRDDTSGAAPASTRW